MRRVGDDTGRGRMSGKSRVQIKPRGGMILTGEYLTGVASSLARGLVISPITSIDGSKLDVYQRQEPLLISTFYYYVIEWYVQHYEEIADSIADALTNFRKTISTASPVHPRLQETQFCLRIAYMLFLRFCEDSDFITTEDARDEVHSFDAQLIELIRAQQARITPADKKPENADFLRLIRKLYKANDFNVAESVEKFDLEKHDGLIHYECLCLRGDRLDERIRKIIPNVQHNDISTRYWMRALYGA